MLTMYTIWLYQTAINTLKHICILIRHISRHMSITEWWLHRGINSVHTMHTPYITYYSAFHKGSKTYVSITWPHSSGIYLYIHMYTVCPRSSGPFI